MVLPVVSVLLAMLCGTSLAQISSLYVPGFDPQPLSVNQLGVGSDGRTTFELLPGTPTGTFDQALFTGTATLVEGPSDAFLTYDDPVAADSLTVQETCTFSGSVAVCIEVGGGTTQTNTEAIESFAIQGGGPVSPTATGGSASITPVAPASASDASSTRSGPGSTSSGPSQTSSGPPPANTNASLSTPFVSASSFMTLLVIWCAAAGFQ